MHYLYHANHNPEDICLQPNLLFCIVEGEQFMVTGVAEHFNQYQGKLWTVIDIGAHIGELSILAANRGAEHIWAIEPDRDNFNLLCENVKVNKYERVIELIQGAIAQDIGGVNLIRRGGNTGQRSILYSSSDSIPGIEKVEGYPLSLLIRMFLKEYPEIDYLKMDIEGAEHEVICRTPKELLRHIAFLDLDVHDLNNREYFDGGPNPQVLLDYLSLCGFETVSRTGDEKAFHMMLKRIGECPTEFETISRDG